jgi:hypothetical protein
MKLFCPVCKEDYFSKTANLNKKHHCGSYGIVDWQYQGQEKEEEGHY